MTLDSRTDEERFVLLCSKAALHDAEIADFNRLMTTHMDWSRVFGLLHTHGVMGTAWLNIAHYYLVDGTEKGIYGSSSVP
ncbi:hypothetical protein HMSSN036_53510 [Paenibacillus macerans]|nr:hypothetical protein HMSSN036_53510 [Paenibacillus macerans]